MIFLSPRWDMLLPCKGILMRPRISYGAFASNFHPWLEFPPVVLVDVRFDSTDSTNGPTERGPWNWHQIVCTTLASRSAAAFGGVFATRKHSLDLFEQVTPCNAYLGIAQQRTRIWFPATFFILITYDIDCGAVSLPSKQLLLRGVSHNLQCFSEGGWVWSMHWSADCFSGHLCQWWVWFCCFHVAENIGNIMIRTSSQTTRPLGMQYLSENKLDATQCYAFRRWLDTPKNYVRIWLDA